MKTLGTICALLLSTVAAIAQNTLEGTVITNDGVLEFATVILDQDRNTQTDGDGRFTFANVADGQHELEVRLIGYTASISLIKLPSPSSEPLSIKMEKSTLLFDEIVVTGTKTWKRQTNSAVIVNVVDNTTLDNVQACNLSEGLKFQPGLRVENNCQTCNYTQLRMNGLAGGYSQVLINGRPIFSPLTGLYGLEQIPVNMIDKIEVVRGGGSSLYGSSAIGGTVNVLTKIPTSNTAIVNTSYQNIGGEANDIILSANATIVPSNGDLGMAIHMNRRDREAYDHNDDNFSEIPEIENTSIGLTSFFLPTENQKLEVSVSHINEYRYGGELTTSPAHLALQAEERTHNVLMASADYQWNFNNGKSSLITYAALQRTDRDHYTGIQPDRDDIEAYNQHLESPPYGTSLTKTFQGGIQLNYEFPNFLQGSNVWTFGTEYLVDDTFDEIPAYRYEIDQITKDLGAFVQSDWEVLPSLSVLSGVRIDHHNLIDRMIVSPRLSLLYKYGDNTQIRASYGTGFRAPQAFDTDLHIAFAGGGISRVVLSEDLKEERSKSYSTSINYDRPTEQWVAGFTIEGFYTQLSDAFALAPIGEDSFGEVFEKRNDQNATVKGGTLEMRANYNRKIQIESGATLQSSTFANEVQYIDEVEGIRDFIRTPRLYGFANLSVYPTSRFTANLNYVYTGSMIVPHFAGAPNQLVDEIVDTPAFSELSAKASYTLPISSSSSLELYAGIKNIFNSYQQDFDIGKNRDSNYVYGPAQPRTVFLGAKWSIQ